MRTEPTSTRWTLIAKAALVVLVAVGVSIAAVGGATAGGTTTAETPASVAASTNDSVATRTVSSTTVSPGGTVTVTLTATGTGSGLSVEEAFDPEIAGATIQSVTVDGSSASTIISQANSNGTVVTLSSVSVDAQFALEYTLSIPANATSGTNFTISGALTGTQETSVGDTELTVVDNTPPEADAGPDQSVTAGETVQLDASGSSDPDGDALSYTWTQTAGASVSLSDGATATPSFTAPSVSSTENLTFEVSAADGNGAQDTDTVNVTVSPASGGSGDAGPTRSTPGTITPGGTATVTLTANATGSAVSITEVFDPAFASATVDSVTVNGNDVSTIVEQGDPNGTVVTVGGLSVGDRVEVTYTVTAPGDAALGSVYTIEGNVTSDETLSLGTDQLTVEEEQSVVARYDTNGDGISITELGIAAADYATGQISIIELGKVAAAYVSG